MTILRTSSLTAGFLAAALFVPTAGAVLLTTDADYSVSGVTLLDDPNAAPAGTVTSEVTVPSIDGGSVDSEDDGYARAINADGVTAVDANAVYFDGEPDRHIARAEAAITDTIANTSGATQDYFYDFTVFGPVLEIADFAGVGLGNNEIRASYLIEILVDGSAVFSSSATLRGGDRDSTLEQEGVILGSTPIGVAPDIFGFQFADLTTTAFLGTFAGGDSFDFEALVEVSVDAAGFETGGRARIGDPGNIGDPRGLSGAIRVSGGTTNVPEPGTLALIGAGALLLGAIGRRRSGASV